MLLTYSTPKSVLIIYGDFVYSKFHLPWIPRQKGKKKSKDHRLEKKLKAKEDWQLIFKDPPPVVKDHYPLIFHI